MRRSSAFLAAFAVLGTAAIAVVPACTSILGDFKLDRTVEAGPGDGGSKPNGQTCGATTECASGFCTDGVCCDSACGGSCESCNGAEKGTCTAVPDGQDPDRECQPAPVLDAGAPLAPSQNDAGDASVDENDAGNVVNIPDGGVTTEAAACGGTCDGARKCKYPGKEKECGTQFCNSTTEGAGLRCDGAGRCELQFSTCDGYACEGTTCNEECVGLADCDAEHFCRDGKCTSKRPNGEECTLPTQCTSGFCIKASAQSPTGVCCNSDCSQIPGGQCDKPTAVGQCQCDACPGRACRFFYRDADGDTHGSETATPANPASVQAGCEGDLPPSGFADKADDCDDADLRAFPGQSQYFDTPRTGVGGFDFNCDKAETKQTKEYPGSQCRFCELPTKDDLACKDTAATCFYDKQPATLTCKLTREIGCLALPGGGTSASCYSCDGTAGRGTIAYDKGFTQTVACGARAIFTDCGACVTKGTTASAPVTTPNHAQRCR